MTDPSLMAGRSATVSTIADRHTGQWIATVDVSGGTRRIIWSLSQIGAPGIESVRNQTDSLMQNVYAAQHAAIA
jgi:hypothetical protein